MELREVVQVGFILFTTFDAVAPAEAKKKVSSESKGEASASKVDDAKAATNVKVVNFKNSGFQYHLKPLEGQS